MKKTVFVLLSCLTLVSCVDNSDNLVEAEVAHKAADTAQTVAISRDVLDEMMQTLPSPIETANLITQSKSTFNKDLLIPAKNAEKFHDKYAQALALGGYGVDLGYINLNNKMLYVIDYLESVNTISDELKVNQFLDFAMLSKLAENRSNVDSLIRISTENFNQIDEYLRSKERGDLSVLILIGSWGKFAQPCEAGRRGFNINHVGETNPCIELTDVSVGKFLDVPMDALLERLRQVDAVQGCQKCYTVCRGNVQALARPLGVRKLAQLLG